MEQKKIERNSSIELLKLAAIILIVFSHAMPFYGSDDVVGHMNLTLATSSLQRFVIVLFRYGGGIGNAIFIVCSSWFLVDSKQLKIKKAWDMACDTFAISIIFLILFLAAGVQISTLDIVEQVFPITFQTNWFVTCYILLYLLHPALNTIIDSFDKKQLLMASGTLFVLYSVIATIYESVFYYTNIVGFIMIYFVVAYIKRYMPKLQSNVRMNVALLTVATACLFLLIFVTNLLGLIIPAFSDKLLHWQGFKNPLILVIALSLFNIAASKSFVNKKINKLAGMTLLVYLVHENYILAHYIRPMIYAFIYNTFTYNAEIMWVVIVAIVLLLFGFAGGVFTISSSKNLSENYRIEYINVLRRCSAD